MKTNNKNDFFPHIYSFLVLSKFRFDKDKYTFYYTAFFTEEAPNVSFEDIHYRMHDIYFKDLVIFDISELHEKDFEIFRQIKGSDTSALSIIKVKP